MEQGWQSGLLSGLRENFGAGGEGGCATTVGKDTSAPV